MGISRFRRGHYLFLRVALTTCHANLYVYRDRKLIVKWNLDDWVPMEGKATKRLQRLLAESVEEGLL